MKQGRAQQSMFRGKHYVSLEGNIAAFNRLTGNNDCSLAIKYLQHFQWRTKEAAKAYIQNVYKRGRSAPSDYDLIIKREDIKLCMGSPTRNTEPNRKTSPLCDERIQNNFTMKRKSFVHLPPVDADDDILDESHTKVRFNFDAQDKKPSSFMSKTEKKPKGILKLCKIESSEVREADERKPSDVNINSYGKTTSAGTSRSSQKEVPQFFDQIEIHESLVTEKVDDSFENYFTFSQDEISRKSTAQFGGRISYSDKNIIFETRLEDIDSPSAL
uniref:Uncharacterized protein n=1 Tax=Euplotes harpa TaxID=151035 RepID=A0A7S3JJG0_9SPIT|mmetsp:Transcript_43430/g.51104  ORF Transcript_43430/g.51104 Transcript_43430/m.51104 type:complete len:272 (+) Transcript_43430:30-845(+)